MASTTAGAAVPGATRKVDVVDLLGRFAPLIMLLVLVIFFSIRDPGFRTSDNAFNVLRQVSFVGIIAVGMTFVILTAGIDLSVGSTLAFAGIVAASAAKGTRSLLTGGVKDEGGIHVLYAFLAAVGVGLLIGLIHGF